MRLVCVWLAMGLVVAHAQSPSLALEDPDTAAARRHYERATALYDSGRYADAITEFVAARALKPLAELDFDIARSYERLERWGDAAEALERYLLHGPIPDADSVRARIATLRSRAATAPSGRS